MCFPAPLTRFSLALTKAELVTSKTEKPRFIQEAFPELKKLKQLNAQFKGVRSACARLSFPEQMCLER